ncbi:MAG TPA: hypothetical protein PK200_01010 [Spirochaetota bacterium]|nr:hypothetical protein [Spirochaetota bacterium]HQO03150.1 hypothetical protein [Spirochaetota bacterium]HQP48272.1 hypothetical protein [Spirochaetota bacterium]
MQKELNLSRKLGFDEIIDHTLHLYKTDFLYYLKILLYFFIPAIALMVYGTIQVKDAYIAMLSTTVSPGTSGAGAFPGLSSIMYYGFLITVVYSLFAVLTGAGVIRGFDNKMQKQNSTEGEIVLETLRKIIPITITTIIASVILGVGFLFCFIPFFILAVYMAFIPQTIMIEGRWGFGSIGRSFSMVNGHFWQTFLIPLVFFLVYFFFSSIITYGILLTPYIELIKGIIRNGGQTDPSLLGNFYQQYSYTIILQSVLNSLLHLLMTPILNIALSIKFYNIRNLKEGTQILNDIAQETSAAQ